MLSNDQKVLLRDLSRDPIWNSILKKADEHVEKSIHYKRDERDEQKKTNEWIFNSGFDRGKNYMLELLRNG